MIIFYLILIYKMGRTRKNKITRTKTRRTKSRRTRVKTRRIKTKMCHKCKKTHSKYQHGG